MVYPYTIDKNILQISSETELDSFIAKSNLFFETIRKRSVCIDCNDAGMYNLLRQEYQNLRGKINDDIIKANFESFFNRHISEKYIFLSRSCSCDDCNKCEIEKNVSSIINKTNVNPKFIVSYKKSLSINGATSVDLNNFNSDTFYCDCRDNTSSEYQTAVDLADGERIIKMNWIDLIRICESGITIIDRNIFGLWNTNFENGLAQFAKVIQHINPNLKLKLITRKVNKHLSKDNTSDFDIYRYIGQKTEEFSQTKIEVALCDSLEHERYILFDEHLGAELNRGLDTFVQRTREDRIKITYHNVTEVINKKNKALNTLIKSGDFQPIRNY